MQFPYETGDPTQGHKDREKEIRDDESHAACLGSNCPHGIQERMHLERGMQGEK